MRLVAPDVAVVAILLAMAFLFDLLVAPQGLPLAAVYAVPLLVAAQRLRSLTTLIFAAVGLLLYAINLALDRVDIGAAALSWASLAVIGYLSYLSAQRLSEAQVARQRLQNFLGMVAHDLRGPLTVVLNYSQVLSRGRESLPAGVSDRATRAIEAESRRMSRLIGDLLDASRIGAGSFTVERQTADLVRIAREVAAEQQATTTNHTIALAAPESLQGYWDADRIRQVLANLIGNAVKYSPGGGEVGVEITSTDGSAVVKVSDHGVGLAPGSAELLFQPFSRLEREPPIRGTGLGLYISKAIVEAHGGHIWAESPGPGQGSTFGFALPVSSSHQRDNHAG